MNSMPIRVTDGTKEGVIVAREPGSTMLTVQWDDMPGPMKVRQVSVQFIAANHAGPTTLTPDEEQELNHWAMWGSNGYPVSKLGRLWTIPHFPTPYRTKREAVAQWERYIEILIDKKAGRL